MRLVLKTAALMLLLAAATAARAIPASDLKENYQPIVDRNPFGLKPPPPPPTNNPSANVKEKPKLEYFLTGITSVGFPRIPKQAYLMTREQNKSTNFYALSEGIEKDGIKILNIDDGARKVRIHTTEEGEMILSFQTHGIAAPASPMPGRPGMPGQPIPGQPGGAVPQPGMPTQPQPINAAAVQNGTMGNAAAANPNAANAIRQIPARRVRSGVDNTMMNGGMGGPLPNAGIPATQQSQPDMDPAEQYVRMHLNRAAAEKQGIPMPPLPIIPQ